MRTGILWVCVVVAWGCDRSGPAQPSKAGPAAVEEITPPVAPRPATPAVKLPGADRVFTLPATQGGAQPVLGALGDELWWVDPTATGVGRLRWRVRGEGVVQRVVLGDLGHGQRLYVARGVGRGFLQAPLVLQALDPRTGAAEELWRDQGARNETAHLSVADVDRDGAPELAFARYASKYNVQARNLKADGAVLDGAPVRMASCRTYGDLDHDGTVDEIVGRVYGDARGDPGDLKVNLGGARGWTSIPTEKGVRAVLWAAIGDSPPALYFADGWLANYGKEAHAQVKRVEWTPQGPRTELVGRSPEEFTFFELLAADVDGDGKAELLGQGNKQLSVFRAASLAPWPRTVAGRFPPVLNVAVGHLPGGAAVLYVPAKAGVRATPIR